MASKPNPRKIASKVGLVTRKSTSSSQEPKKAKLQNPSATMTKEEIVTDTDGTGDVTLTADPEPTLCTSTALRAAHASSLYQKMLLDVSNYEKKLMQEVLIKQCDENIKLKSRIMELEGELVKAKNKCMGLEDQLKYGSRLKKRVRFQLPAEKTLTDTDPQCVQSQREGTDLEQSLNDDKGKDDEVATPPTFDNPLDTNF